jgi:hypothetical protein
MMPEDQAGVKAEAGGQTIDRRFRRRAGVPDHGDKQSNEHRGLWNLSKWRARPLGIAI